MEMAFRYGKYQCLGKNIAHLELNKVFVEVSLFQSAASDPNKYLRQLLRKFEFTVVNPAEPWESFNAGLRIHKNMWMVVTKRESRL